jgi:hypothetical protein
MLYTDVKRRTWIPLTACTLASFLTGCGPFGTSGALGNGAFAYECAGSNDAFCEGLVFPVSGQLPDVAVGGTFNILYNGEMPETKDGIEFQVAVVPASTELVETVTGVGFRVTAAGDTSFLARGANGVVADFVTVRVLTTDHLEVLSGGSSIIQLNLQTSTQENLRVVPLDENNEKLAGNLTYAWSSSDESIVTIGGSSSNDASVQAVAPGTATVTVTLGELHADIPITVQDMP